MEYSILLIPLMIIVVGYLMFKYPPKKINYVIGYRTLKSMKNIDNWNFANKYCGKLLIKMGLIMLLICLVMIILTFMKIIIFTETILLVVIFFQLALLILSIFIVENMLKNYNNK